MQNRIEEQQDIMDAVHMPWLHNLPLDQVDNDYDLFGLQHGHLSIQDYAGNVK